MPRSPKKTTGNKKPDHSGKDATCTEMTLPVANVNNRHAATKHKAKLAKDNISDQKDKKGDSSNQNKVKPKVTVVKGHKNDSTEVDTRYTETVELEEDCEVIQ